MHPQGDDTQALHYDPAATRHRRERALLYVHIASGIAAIGVMAATAPAANWNLGLLAIITMLSVCSELTSVEVASTHMRISGSFLGIVLAAVLLNGAPAALVGITTVGLGWFRSRESPAPLRHNLVTFTWVPLLTGLLFHAAVNASGLTSANAGYYGLALAAFVFALGVNVVMAAGFVAYRDRESLTSQFQRSALFSLLIAEMFSALLTLVAIYLATQIGEGILALFALLLLMFQYLVGQLLISQERGEELHEIATTDELTGLPNRKRFMEALDDAIETYDGLLVLLLDLDHFKEINDTLGHAYGDRVLAELGPRLLDTLGPGPIVARLGGDEFAIMLPDYRANQETPDRLASRLIEEIREPVRIDDVSLAVDTSIGIARFPEDGSDAQTLMRRADIAMYAAKENRDGFHLYRADHDLQSAQRLTVLGDFRRALMTDEVILYFQPIVDLRTRQVIGAESLVRWMHPDMGLLSPDAFLQVVEQTGMVGPLASLVLERAIQQAVGWRQNGRELTVAVNLSVRNLLNQKLASEVDRLLARYALPSHLLQVEITESMFLSDRERVLHTVRELRRGGIKLAVDDYGTGHSTLANLKLLEVDELKIDRSFVMNMLADQRDQIIVRSTIELGHELGLLIVAEGVEDADTLASLSDLGCDLAQGYYLARPMPADAFPGWVESFEARNLSVS